MTSRSSVLLAVLVAAVALLAWAMLTWGRGSGAASTPAEIVDRLDALDGRLVELTERLDALEQARTTAPTLTESIGARQEAAPPLPATAAPKDDPRAILARYVASFADDGEGSDYFRLLVDAYVKELVDPICALLVEPARPLTLRLALARMLGKTSLRGDARVLDAFVSVLRQNGSQALALACLESWAKVGGAADAPRLEAILWQIEDPEVRRPALHVLLRSVGEQANATILRLLASAPDDQAAGLLLRALDSSDLEAALSVFRQASRMQQPSRLVAAQRIGEFEGETFERFVDEWLGFESDAKVRELLGAAKQRQRNGAGWSALQATGAPNADPKRDDPKAWAPRDPEMGMQWLELRYARADRVSGVRIFEVNAPGAVAEVRALDPQGQWHLLWSGTASAGGQGPLVLTFAPTAFATQALRIVLDTNRTQGWNEIDAVELIGVAGPQFATGARASSSYAQQVARAASANDAMQEARVLEGLRTQRPRR